MICKLSYIILYIQRMSYEYNISCMLCIICILCIISILCILCYIYILSIIYLLIWFPNGSPMAPAIQGVRTRVKRKDASCASTRRRSRVKGPPKMAKDRTFLATSCDGCGSPWDAPGPENPGLLSCCSRCYCLVN